MDDDDIILDTLVKDLKELKYTGEMSIAYNGEEAQEIIGSQSIDFIICDYFMPGVSGKDFLTYVRSKPKYKDIPFLMLTSNNDFETVNECIELGVSNYLLKPWNLADLEKKILSSWKKSYDIKM
ncbi:MAG: response regulator [Bacteriovoracaceae bacterium]|nr:response regulator [Bacteriovoracaceae bacterium]